MGIQNQLALDHFYISVSADQFESLLPLTKILSNATHSKVQSGSDSWEGIYIKCRSGAYFEIIRERRPGGLGVAISPAIPYYTDAAKLLDEYPGLPWQTGSRVWSDGLPWFDWFSLGEYLNVQDTIFNAWLMKYHLSHRESRPAITPCSIDRFCKLEIELGADHLETLKFLAQWLPGKRISHTESIEVIIPDRDGSQFVVSISLVPGDSRFTFKSLAMDLTRSSSAVDQKLGNFQLTTTQDRLTFALLKSSADGPATPPEK